MQYQSPSVILKLLQQNMSTPAAMVDMREMVMETSEVMLLVFDFWNDSGVTDAPDGHDELFAMFLDEFECVFCVDS